MHSWILPEYIEDILPPEAETIERLRRTLLDHFRDHGYRLVQPPLIEHLDSLLTGTGHDLELQTFKVIDPLSGRLLGVRADITPQVARIDAHLLNEPGVTRLCYAGSVLRTVVAGLAQTYSVTGELLSKEEYEKHLKEVTPTEEDIEFVINLEKEKGWIIDPQQTSAPAK